MEAGNTGGPERRGGVGIGWGQIDVRGIGVGRIEIGRIGVGRNWRWEELALGGLALGDWLWGDW